MPISALARDRFREQKSHPIGWLFLLPVGKFDFPLELSHYEIK
jgi:hypothetical protein